MATPDSPILSFGNPFYNEASQLFRPPCFFRSRIRAGVFCTRTHPYSADHPAVTLSGGAQAPTTGPSGFLDYDFGSARNDRFAVTLSGATAKSKGLDIAEPHRRGAHGFPPGRPPGFLDYAFGFARNDSNPQRQNTPEVETSRNSRRAEAHAQKKQRATFVTLCFVENTRVELVTSCMPCKRSSQLS